MITMMFSLSFAVVLFIILGINGQTDDINTFRPNNLEKGYPFGKLRLAEEGKNEELIPPTDIEKPQITTPDQSSGVHPLPSPCIGASSLTKIVYPRDKTKYIQCRDEFHYEIFTCPNGGEYNEQTDSCDLIVPLIDKCEEEKPCLNDGHCQSFSNSTFKCTCRPDWTGEKCETPINSCVKKPCGLNADCRTLKTVDYEQDYVCVCHVTRGYGLTCQETVPNPCLTTSEQFFPYAFSQHAYIQCDGELVHFQPCGPVLYWNQEQKICDRKRPAKMDFPALLTKLVSNTMENKQEKDEEITSTTTIIITTTEQTEQQNENGRENEGIFAFVPARIANRQQLLANVNNQQGLFGQNLRENDQKTQELPNQSVGSNQIRQDFISRTQQWPHHQTESTLRQPPTIQSGQNQPGLQNNQQQQQWTPLLTEPSSINSNIDQSQIRQDNQQQQQSFPQQNQAFGSQPWLNQVPDMKKQNTQRFGSQSQPWQGSQTVQNQPTTFETTTVAQNINRFQGFQNPNIQVQDQSPQIRSNTQMTGNQLPQSIGFNLQNTQHFATLPQSWQNSQTIQNQPGLQNQNQQTFLETATVPQNIDRFQAFQNPTIQAQEQSWQHRPSTQLTGNQSPQSTGFNTQNFGPQPQPWQSSHTLQNQQRLQDQNQQFETTTAAQNVFRLQGFQDPNIQMTGNQVPQTVGFNLQNTQNFVSQKPWQSKGNNQIRQNFIQPEASSVDIQRVRLNNGQLLVDQSLQNQQLPSTLSSQSVTDLNNGQLQRGIQSQIKQDNQQQNQVFGSQPWLNQVPDMKTQNNQRFGSQSQPWQGSQIVQNEPQFSNQIQQTNFETTTVAQNINRFQGFQNPNTQVQDQSWQTRLNTQQIQNQPTQPQSNPVIAFQPKQRPDTLKQSLTIKPSSEIQNLQFGLNQQQKSIPIQNFFDQKPSWSNNQQFQPQGDPSIESNEFTQNFPGRSIISSQNGNSFETSTISNNGLPIQNLRGWQSNRPIEQDNNQITQTEQRKTLDSIPTLLSGSWKSRS